jgi:DNA-binding NarL/FixJ family response regulator
MFGWLMKIFNKPSLESFDSALTRERLIQSARIVVVDDETPLLVEELVRAGFAVNHDTTGNDLKPFDAQLYDVAIVDYHGVGQKLGPAQGLELIKYIRRVSPRTRVIAYTSRSLNSTESEFFRTSHVVLPKDLGLGDSLELVEKEVRKAFAKEHLLEALLARLQLSSPADRKRVETALIAALSNRDERSFRSFVTKSAGVVAEKSVDIIIAHIFGP